MTLCSMVNEEMIFLLKNRNKCAKRPVWPFLRFAGQKSKVVQNIIHYLLAFLIYNWARKVQIFSVEFSKKNYLKREHTTLVMFAFHTLDQRRAENKFGQTGQAFFNDLTSSKQNKIWKMIVVVFFKDLEYLHLVY